MHKGKKNVKEIKLEEELKDKSKQSLGSINGETRNIKLKDRLDLISKEFFIKTENPLEKLKFQQADNLYKGIKAKIFFVDKFFTYKLLISFFVILLLIASIFFNNNLKEKYDPHLIKAFSLTFQNIKNAFLMPSKFIFCLACKPYVVTIGEYKNISIAKNEAIKLLPQLRQINIKEIGSGFFTFEAERFSSNKKAELYAGELKHKGFKLVQVRYIDK